jgi:hypothetical protein
LTWLLTPVPTARHDTYYDCGHCHSCREIYEHVADIRAAVGTKTFTSISTLQFDRICFSPFGFYYLVLLPHTSLYAIFEYSLFCSYQGRHQLVDI